MCSVLFREPVKKPRCTFLVQICCLMYATRLLTIQFSQPLYIYSYIILHCDLKEIIISLQGAITVGEHQKI